MAVMSLRTGMSLMTKFILNNTPNAPATELATSTESL